MRTALLVRLIAATRPPCCIAPTTASIASTDRLTARMDLETLNARNSYPMGDR